MAVLGPVLPVLRAAELLRRAELLALRAEARLALPAPLALPVRAVALPAPLPVAELPELPEPLAGARGAATRLLLHNSSPTAGVAPASTRPAFKLTTEPV